MICPICGIKMTVCDSDETCEIIVWVFCCPNCGYEVVETDIDVEEINEFDPDHDWDLTS